MNNALSSRELAYQIADQFRVFGSHIGLKDVVIVGGIGKYVTFSRFDSGLSMLQVAAEISVVVVAPPPPPLYFILLTYSIRKIQHSGALFLLSIIYLRRSIPRLHLRTNYTLVGYIDA